MAAAYICVEVAGKRIRTFGGNRADVKAKKRYYDNMTLEMFLKQHPNCTPADFENLEVIYVRKNR